VGDTAFGIRHPSFLLIYSVILIEPQANFVTCLGPFEVVVMIFTSGNDFQTSMRGKRNQAHVRSCFPGRNFTIKIHAYPAD
ncbi:mCG145538, partial [Mus musculus]